MSNSMRRHRAARLLGAASVSALALAAAAPQASAQMACPSPPAVSDSACQLANTTVATSAANPIGLSASGAAGALSANAVTVNLAVAGATGAKASSGGDITLAGGMATTTVVGPAANAQVGLFATGAGSTVQATGYTVDLTPASGVTAGMTGALAEAGGAITLDNSQVVVTGGTGTTSTLNHGLVARGGQITMTGGAVSTAARGSFGAWADTGGVITLTDVTVATTGAASTVSPSHVLFADGPGATITATRGAYSTTGTGQSITNPTAVLRAENGGVIHLIGNGTGADRTVISTTGKNGTPVYVGAGSTIEISDAAISAASTNLYGADAIGGQLSINRSSITSAQTLVVHAASDARVSLTDVDVLAASTTLPAHGVQIQSGSTATLLRGSVTTTGPNATALTAGSADAAHPASLTATNVTVLTTGDGNAFGVTAEPNSHVVVTGGTITTTGVKTGTAAARDERRPQGAVARQGDAVLDLSALSISTRGVEGHGVTTDDGATANLNDVRIATQGDLAVGLFAVVEQAGPARLASINGAGVTIETSGASAWGASADQNFFDAPARIALTGATTITTTGDNATGLRAIDGGGISAAGAVVRTSGVGAHGALARDDATGARSSHDVSLVSLTGGTKLATTGERAHGAVAQDGGRINGDGFEITATGRDAAALYVTGATPASTAVLANGKLTNASGPTIAVGGVGAITLSNVTVGGSGEWLRVSSPDAFPNLAAGADLGGPNLSDEIPPEEGGAPAEARQAAIQPFSADHALAAPNTPGLATLDISGSTLNGSAFTAPGSVSNVTLRNATTWNMTGSSNLTSLVNDASSILFSAPGGDRALQASYKTLTVRNYVGASGGVIGLNTRLGADDSPSDRLVIDGGSASGVTGLAVANAGGQGALTLNNGILVVDTKNGGATNPTAFRLAGPVAAGPYEYTLFRGSKDASNPQAWYLRSTLPPAPPPPDPPGPPTPPNPPPPPTPPPTPPEPPSPPSPPTPPPNPHPEPAPPDPRANVRAEISLYTALPALAALYGRTAIDTLHARVGDEELLRGEPHSRDDENFNGVWARLIGWTGHRDGDANGIYGDGGPKFDYDLYALQAGADLYRAEHDNGTRDHAGIYGIAGHAEGEAKHVDGTSAGKDAIDAYSLGAYWTRFGRRGGYLDGVAQFTWYDGKAQSVRLPELKGDSTAYALSLEAGQPFEVNADWIVEPQAQLIYQHFNGDQTSDVAARVTFTHTESMIGRLGLRAARTWVRVDEDGEQRLTRGWARLNLLHEFMDSPATLVSSDQGEVLFNADVGGDWLELNGGVTRQMSRNATLYFDVGYQWDLEGKGYALSGKLGMRVNW